ncbi:hypothetical protein A1F99_057170 [Pyrenophora tritici-repentis]|nr:hypothetical protein A1F99_057170 [Pyrenophora tritici-repentis]KAI1561081.1 hypothetical protein PtrEW7m1_011343 [Pyrenophora tritici-repentis]
MASSTDIVDMLVYHPHDLLIAKYFPDEDLPSQYEDIWAFSMMYVNARYFERMQDSPPCVPWPLPPPRPRESLEPGVEEWRSIALDAIDARLSLYTFGVTTPRTQTTSAEEVQKSSASDHAVHRALRIPKLLEAILRHATHKAQYTAWNVSSLWRDTIRNILASEY